MRLSGVVLFSLLILFGGCNLVFADEYAYLTVAVRSNANHKPIAHANLKIHTTSNYHLWSVPEYTTIQADEGGTARFLNIRRIDLKQGGSKNNRRAYMRLQFDITASAPGFRESHQRVFLDYEKPRPRTTIYLAPAGAGGKNAARRQKPASDPFEEVGYCPDSGDCSQRGQKVTCKQIGGKWQCWTGKYSAHTADRYQAIGMACGCMNATNWDIERRQRSKPTQNQTIQSLPKRNSRPGTGKRQNSVPAKSPSHLNLPAATFKPDNEKALRDGKLLPEEIRLLSMSPAQRFNAMEKCVLCPYETKPGRPVGIRHMGIGVEIMHCDTGRGRRWNIYASVMVPPEVQAGKVGLAGWQETHPLNEAYGPYWSNMYYGIKKTRVKFIAQRLRSCDEAIRIRRELMNSRYSKYIAW